MLIALIMDGGLLLEVNMVQEFVAKAQVYKSSVKTAVHYVEHSHHHMIKSGVVIYTGADEAVRKKMAKGALVPLKPWIATPGLVRVPWSMLQA